MKYSTLSLQKFHQHNSLKPLEYYYVIYSGKYTAGDGSLFIFFRLFLVTENDADKNFRKDEKLKRGFQTSTPCEWSSFEGESLSANQQDKRSLPDTFRPP